jgi:nitrogen fixation protein NifX
MVAHLQPDEFGSHEFRQWCHFPIRGWRRFFVGSSHQSEQGVCMKIAFTTSTGEIIDQHFGQCQSFHIWEVGPDEASFLEAVGVGEHGGDEEDRIAARAQLLSDCAIVYTMQIGGPAAAKLVAQKIHPMKTNSEVSLKETVERLQEVLRGNPPPWLRKAMNKGATPSFLED